MSQAKVIRWKGLIRLLKKTLKLMLHSIVDAIEFIQQPALQKFIFISMASQILSFDFGIGEEMRRFAWKSIQLSHYITRLQLLIYACSRSAIIQLCCIKLCALQRMQSYFRRPACVFMPPSILYLLLLGGYCISRIVTYICLT